jgi:hypothetical protein
LLARKLWLLLVCLGLRARLAAHLHTTHTLCDPIYICIRARLRRIRVWDPALGSRHHVGSPSRWLILGLIA